MPDINPDRWREIVVLSGRQVPGATAALSERRRQALEELIAEVERLHTRLAELVRSIEAGAERKQ